jgi:hypothetical protein
MAHTDHTVSAMDTECYIDYWLCQFSTGEVFQMFPGHALDTDGLRKALSSYTVITFNGNSYDMPIIALALAGYNNRQLKEASDMLIVNGVKWWQLLDHYGQKRIEWVDHIDMIEVAPGKGSLKAYMGKMHSKKLQDLPIDPSASIAWYDRVMLREYCNNDLRGTMELYETFPSQIRLREEMGMEYGIELRSKSDAQIAEAVMKSLLPFKVEVPQYLPGSTFYYRPPEWLKSSHLDLLARSPFTITQGGGVEMSDELADTIIRIGNTSYKMGMGGLHSMESSVSHVADDEYVIEDWDVASYYPSLILRTDIAPKQIGDVFKSIYRGWYDIRLAAKREGNKKVANSLKTLLNGTFGKLGSCYSIFYAPSEMVQVTITGQLSLLMLIEELESCGISVISANTDGVVLRYHRSMTTLVTSIIKWWESVTQFEMEHTQYRMLASRDVNSYVAIKPDGEIKLKGAFAPPEPGASGWPNPTGQVCVDAVSAYLRDGTPLEDTICSCTDIRQFVHVRQVKGGGSYCPNGVLPKKTTLKAMREATGVAADGDKVSLTAAYAALCEREIASREYLGKVVRWYYATGSKGCIVTPAGGLVARTEGCTPCMTLPDTLPEDVDYEWYVNEAASMLRDVGVKI